MEMKTKIQWERKIKWKRNRKWKHKRIWKRKRKWKWKRKHLALTRSFAWRSLTRLQYGTYYISISMSSSICICITISIDISICISISIKICGIHSMISISISISIGIWICISISIHITRRLCICCALVHWCPPPVMFSPRDTLHRKPFKTTPATIPTPPSSSMAAMQHMQSCLKLELT